ncbi:MAG: HNH endonuclease domain-containing protein [Candidatus Wallbacteria bacterium]
MNKLPANEKLNINAFENMLELKYLTNSYKIYWFYSIFEEIKKGDSVLLFKNIILKMICKAWYPVIQYRLNLGQLDQLTNIILFIKDKYNFDIEINDEKLFSELQKINDEKLDKMIFDLCKYVPYRLLSPFYDRDLRGIPDSDKNKYITAFSLNDNYALYKIKNDEIIINEIWFEYIYHNQAIIEGWLNYKLIYYLQKRNPNVPAIPLKIYPPQKRDLSGATKFWKKIITHKSITDIYSNTIITPDNLSIDHFIPWSFVLHDELWNLIPTKKNINSSKSDNLPDLNLYLEKFCEMQFLAISISIENKFPKKELESYVNIGLDLTKTNLNLIEFNQRLHETIKPLHQLAFNQGFMIWRY